MNMYSCFFFCVIDSSLSGLFHGCLLIFFPFPFQINKQIRSFVDKLIERHMAMNPVGKP